VPCVAAGVHASKCEKAFNAVGNVLTPKASIDEAENGGLREASVHEEQLLQCCHRAYNIAGTGHANVHTLFIPVRFAVAEVERDVISVDTDVPSEDVVALKDRWVCSISGIVGDFAQAQETRVFKRGAEVKIIQLGMFGWIFHADAEHRS
jgi:hypothetical protein